MIRKESSFEGWRNNKMILNKEITIKNQITCLRFRYSSNTIRIPFSCPILFFPSLTNVSVINVALSKTLYHLNKWGNFKIALLIEMKCWAGRMLWILMTLSWITVTLILTRIKFLFKLLMIPIVRNLNRNLKKDKNPEVSKRSKKYSLLKGQRFPCLNSKEGNQIVLRIL